MSARRTWLCCGESIREALDKGEFVLDLAAIGLGLLLRLLELVGRGVLFEGDLYAVSGGSVLQGANSLR